MPEEMVTLTYLNSSFNAGRHGEVKADVITQPENQNASFKQVSVSVIAEESP